MASKEVDGNERSAKRRKLVLRSRYAYIGKERVDESDYRIAEKLFKLFKQFNKNSHDGLKRARSQKWRETMDLCQYHDDGRLEDGRIYDLWIPQLGRPIPEDILRMDALEKLNINCYDMGKVANWFPRRFGTLTRVKKLIMALGNGYVLPEEISDLPNLEHLHITAERKVIIPRSFSNLHNLKKIFIQIDFASSSVSFPNSIGGLTSLKEVEILNLGELPKDMECFASIESLHVRGKFITIPNSIRTLKKLKKLSLWRFYNKYDMKEGEPVITLPSGMGELTSLEEICLEMNVKTLPPSIGKLKNLKYLDLENTEIISLPDEIGDAANLEVIDIGRTQVRKLPSSVTNLKKLRRLHLSHEILKKHNASEFQMISKLINDLPQLGCLGYRHGFLYEPETPETLSFAYTLLRNRARTRMNSFNSGEGGASFPVAAWPFALHQAMKLFRPYANGKDDGTYIEECWCCEQNLIRKLTTQSDAIYQLLVNYGATIIAKGHA